MTAERNDETRTGVHQLAVDVELQVVRRAVADPDRLLSLVAVEVTKLVLVNLLASVNRVPVARQRKIGEETFSSVKARPKWQV